MHIILQSVIIFQCTYYSVNGVTINCISYWKSRIAGILLLKAWKKIVQRRTPQ